MNIFSLVTGIVTPLANLIDKLHPSDEERLKIKAEMFLLQSEFASKVMAYEQQLLEAKAKVITAEANGQSWLQRTWRPITMLTFLVLVVCDSFGLLAFRLSDQAWTLLQIGLGGYVAGRSLEKVTPALMRMRKGNEGS